MTGERNRNKNFSERECFELVRAVQKFAHIIECKTPGKYKNEEKTAAWEAVGRQFNKNTLNNRGASALREKWKKDKSNVRDYIQYLKTSKSRSGRSPKDIPKPKFMSAIANLMGIECSALEPVPDIKELSFDSLGVAKSLNVIKSEPISDMTDLSFEQIMLTDDSDQFNYVHEDSSTNDEFHDIELKTQSSQSQLTEKINKTYISSHIKEHLGQSSNPMIQQLQIDLLKREIEVQELLATELKVKIERTRQLMKMEAEEGALRCREILKRLET